MKNIFLLAAFALSSLSLLKAQSYNLGGELSIYLKNGEVLTGNYKVYGTKIKNSNINYQDVDSIKQGEDLYEYVKIAKNKVYLLKVEGVSTIRLKSNKVTFYQGRPQDAVHASPVYIGGRLAGSVPNGEVVTTHASYMFKEGMDYALEYKSWKAGDLIEKYFSDCPLLMDAWKDKEKRKNMTMTTFTIFKIYTDGCVDKFGLLNYKMK